MSHLPEFIVQNPPLGDPQAPPPYRFEDVGINIHVVQANGQRLRAACDYYINDVLARGNNPYRVSPLAGREKGIVYVELLRYGRMYSSAPGHERLGYTKQNELLIAIPVVLKDQAGIPVAVGTFTPIVVVDQGLSLITGRDVAGFPKIDGAFNLPEDPSNPRARRVSTLAIRTYSSGTEIQDQTLIETRPAAGTTVVRPIRAAQAGGLVGPGDGGRQVDDPKYLWPFGPVDELYGRGTEFEVDATTQELLKQSAGVKLTSYGLKQFRDAEEPGKACYQNIVQGDTRILRFVGGGLLPPTEIEIQKYDSIDIVKSLGIDARGTIVKPLFGFWYHADFNLTDMENMVQSPDCGQRRIPQPDCYDHWVDCAKASVDLVKGMTKLWLCSLETFYGCGRRRVK